MMYYKPHQLFDLVSPFLPENPIILEAGAFTGHDSVRLARAWPRGKVHAFEPVAQLFHELEARTQPYSNISCYQQALSNQTGYADIYLSENPKRPGLVSQANSLHKPKERLSHSPLRFTHTIQVPTITVGEWARTQNITHIDFVWLDLQGHELTVLQSFGALLDTVRVIHTEVSFIESYEGIPHYHEVKAWLEKNNFKEYARDFENETDWFFSNSVFIHQSLLS